MDTEILSIAAGTISSLIFVTSHMPMLWKAFRTKDLHSYSSVNIILVNVGNMIYWVYILSLPLGPIWILHIFYTISSGLLFCLYFLTCSSRLDRLNPFRRPKAAEKC